MSYNNSSYKIKSVLNFRDIGGVPASNRSRIKKCIIYRSANPDRISRKDAGMLKELGIRTIIDLRAQREVRKKRREIENADIISLPLDFEQKTREKLMPYLRKKNSETVIADISHDLYLEMLDAAGPALKTILDLLLLPGREPILIHCQAGKDRTGIISALIQLLLGADRQTIVDEYMRSNDELLPFFKRMLLIRKIMSLGFFPSDTILYAITVRKRNIESVIDRVENHHGGIVSFLSSAGFDKAQIARVKERLIE